MFPVLENKDKSIQDLVGYLLNKHGSDKFLVKDYWDIDETAIGFADLSEQCLIYVTTAGFEISGYYVALENPPNKNSDLPYEPAGDFDNLGLPELKKLLLKHLKINK